MKDASRRSRARWLRIALGVGVVVAAHALGGGSAQGAPIGARAFGEAMIGPPGVGAAMIGSPIVGVTGIGSPDVEATRIAAAHDASASPAVVLAGLTSQSYPAFFKLAGGAKVLTVAAIALDMNCTSGANFVLDDGFVRVPVHPNGRIVVRFSIPATTASNGVSYTGKDSLTAHVNRNRSALSGIWHLQLSYSFTNGMTDRCDSGSVRFTATG